jgi:hypothetical protein
MLYLIIAFFFGLAGAAVARIKGTSMILWFLISAVVPMIGLAAAMLYRYEFDEPDRPCPRCGRSCKVYAALCMRCGMELEFPEHQHSATIGNAAA